MRTPLVPTVPVPWEAPPSREASVPMAAGQTGNPRGGAVSLLALATQIRRTTGDDEELLAFYCSVFRDEFSVFQGKSISVPGRRGPLIPSLDHRMQAANWLADRRANHARSWSYTDAIRRRECSHSAGDLSLPRWPCQSSPRSRRR